MAEKAGQGAGGYPQHGAGGYLQQGARGYPPSAGYLPQSQPGSHGQHGYLQTDYNRVQPMTQTVANRLADDCNMAEATTMSHRARNLMITSIVIGVIWIILAK